MKPLQIATHLHQLSYGIVNAYAITTPEGDWVLVDTGMPFSFKSLKALDEHFGKAPLAIFLTHGHQDHAGSAAALAEEWSVRVYTSKLEAPFLSGKSAYPPADPTVGGVLAQISRVAPVATVNLEGLLELYPEDGVAPFLPDWKIVPTPGHSPGHVALWHEADRVLIAGDALATIDCDSLLGLATQEQLLRPAGSPFIPDWDLYRRSVGVMADLEPVVVAPGHGQPISSGDLPDLMREFEREFKKPSHGRYVDDPVRSDENGVTYLPPKAEDSLARSVATVAGVATVLAVGAKFLSSRKKSS